MTDWPQAPVPSWRECLYLAEGFAQGDAVTSAYIFRGQSDARWTLKPSLARVAGQGSLSTEQLLGLERELQRRFREQAHQFLGPGVLRPETSLVGWWALMQHYGCPTRLLDWTTSFLVAAYFAAVERWDTDGAIWLVHLHTLDVGMAARFAGYQPFPGDPAGFVDPSSAAELHHFVRSEATDRMIAQQGSFTVCKQPAADHADIIADVVPMKELSGARVSELTRAKIVIPKELKPYFLVQLRAANVTANALFPGLDGLGRSLRETALAYTLGAAGGFQLPIRPPGA